MINIHIPTETTERNGQLFPFRKVALWRCVPLLQALIKDGQIEFPKEAARLFLIFSNWLHDIRPRYVDDEGRALHKLGLHILADILETQHLERQSYDELRQHFDRRYTTPEFTKCLYRPR